MLGFSPDHISSGVLNFLTVEGDLLIKYLIKLLVFELNVKCQSILKKYNKYTKDTIKLKKIEQSQ